MAKVYVVYREDYYTNDGCTADMDKEIEKIFDTETKAIDYVHARLMDERKRACEKLGYDVEKFNIDGYDSTNRDHITEGVGMLITDGEDWHYTLCFTYESYDVE